LKSARDLIIPFPIEIESTLEIIANLNKKKVGTLHININELL